MNDYDSKMLLFLPFRGRLGNINYKDYRFWRISIIEWLRKRKSLIRLLLLFFGSHKKIEGCFIWLCFIVWTVRKLITTLIPRYSSSFWRWVCSKFRKAATVGYICFGHSYLVCNVPYGSVNVFEFFIRFVKFKGDCTVFESAKEGMGWANIPQSVTKGEFDGFWT